MGFFANLFRKKHYSSAVFIDIGSASVGGAYGYVVPDAAPALFYSCRASVVSRAGESLERAMLRTLEEVCLRLVREGGPLLFARTGSGTPDAVRVSLGAPWQRIVLHTEECEQDEPFEYTHALASAVCERAQGAMEGYACADVRVVSVALNGYEASEPYGKYARRAMTTVLVSHLEERVMAPVRALVTRFYHEQNSGFVAASAIRYQALRRVFPYERSALLVDATDPRVSLSLVSDGLLVAHAETADRAGLDARAFLELAEDTSLPQAVFVVASEEGVLVCKNAFAKALTCGVWRRGAPVIVQVAAPHLGHLVRTEGVSLPDAHLLLMATAHFLCKS